MNNFRSLYFQRFTMRIGRTPADVAPQVMESFRIEPKTTAHNLLKRPVSLKRHLKWKEVDNLQMVMRKADEWTDFPEKGLRLISAEVRAGAEVQRIDLLYLRDDGGVFPCELKVGGTDPDTHGQLIRYIADLDGRKITTKWIQSHRAKYFRRKAERAFTPTDVENDWIEFQKRGPDLHKIPLRIIAKYGIIIDEKFPKKLIRAVRYLNDQCGLSIRLIRAQAYVADSFITPDRDHLMRLDFQEQELR